MPNPCFPAKGNPARMRWDATATGIIIEAGPEQSVIKFADKRERCYPNEQFEPNPDVKTLSRKSE